MWPIRQPCFVERDPSIQNSEQELFWKSIFSTEKVWFQRKDQNTNCEIKKEEEEIFA